VPHDKDGHYIQGLRLAMTSSDINLTFHCHIGVCLD